RTLGVEREESTRLERKSKNPIHLPECFSLYGRCGAISKSVHQGNHGVAVGGEGAGLARLRARSNASKLAASSAAAIMKMANFRRLQDGSTVSAGTFAVRFIPCGVASKAQEIYSAM